LLLIFDISVPDKPLIPLRQYFFQPENAQFMLVPENSPATFFDIKTRENSASYKNFTIK